MSTTTRKRLGGSGHRVSRGGAGRVHAFNKPRIDERFEEFLGDTLATRLPRMVQAVRSPETGRLCVPSGTAVGEAVRVRGRRRKGAAKIRGNQWSRSCRSQFHDFVTVNIDGALKLGIFTMTFVDLEVPVAGLPITVTRTYDTLNANKLDEFGYGWSLDVADEKDRHFLFAIWSVGSYRNDRDAFST